MNFVRHRLDLEPLESREMLSANGLAGEYLLHRFRGMPSVRSTEVAPPESVVEVAPPESVVEVAPPESVVETIVDPLFSPGSPEVAGSTEPAAAIRPLDDTGPFVGTKPEISDQPINHRPRTSGLSDLIVEPGIESTVIDLFAAFDDIEDADELLTFEVVSVSNSALFDALTIDDQAGTLTLEYAQGALGSSTVVLRATDTEGLSVEMTAAGTEFSVFELFGVHADSDFRPKEMDVDPMRLLTGWAFFDYDPATGFDETSLNEDLLRGWLNGFSEPYNNPIVFNIESPLYDNSPEGRDNLARVLDVAHEERPDLDFGYYRLLPERNWWAPVGYQRGLDAIKNGDLDDWWAYNLNNGNNYQAQYDAWLARNELYRTEEVSSKLSGGTVAERVDVVYPSLYMPYEPAYDVEPDPLVLDWQVYAEHNIAEARKFDVPVKAFISPSVAGRGESFFSKEFFRQQLDTLHALTDGVIIFAAAGNDPFLPENDAWIEALDEFMEDIQTPTEFTVTLPPPGAVVTMLTVLPVVTMPTSSPMPAPGDQTPAVLDDADRFAETAPGSGTTDDSPASSTADRSSHELSEASHPDASVTGLAPTKVGTAPKTFIKLFRARLFAFANVLGQRGL